MFDKFKNPKFGFTLAEVLITLGVIGIVAALTMPTLIANHQKKQVAVKLSRFYSIMNQAILKWQNSLNILPEDVQLPDTSGATLMNWFNNSLGQEVQTTNKEQDGIYLKVAFNDGSGFVAHTSNKKTIYFFYCTEYKYCAPESFDGKRTFLFMLSNGEFGPYGMWDDDRDTALKGCKYGNTDSPNVSSKGRRHYCARLIQLDGWQIKDDYPWQQIMLEN